MLWDVFVIASGVVKAPRLSKIRCGLSAALRTVVATPLRVSVVELVLVLTTNSNINISISNHIRSHRDDARAARLPTLRRTSTTTVHGCRLLGQHSAAVSCNDAAV